MRFPLCSFVVHQFICRHDSLLGTKTNAVQYTLMQVPVPHLCQVKVLYCHNIYSEYLIPFEYLILSSETSQR